jgi:hypothetical protein
MSLLFAQALACHPAFMLRLLKSFWDLT